MKKIIFIGVTMIVLSAPCWVRAEVCEIANGSFEADNISIPDITVKEPNGWTPDIPAGNFTGYVRAEWPQDGKYNLTFESGYWASFQPGDIITVSQDVYLADTNQITFDIKLDEFGLPGWDSDVCTAVVLIDDEVAWDSNTAGLLTSGNHPGQVCMTTDKRFRTGDPHKLSLGMRVNTEGLIPGRYITHWDVVDCNTACRGGGFLRADLDCSCCIEINDIKAMAEIWLTDDIDPNDAWNLSHDGDDLTSHAAIDFYDFAVYAGDWDGTFNGLQAIAEFWLADDVEPDYEYNIFKEDDITPSAEINFMDLAVLGNNWHQCSIVEEE